MFRRLAADAARRCESADLATPLMTLGDSCVADHGTAKYVTALRCANFASAPAAAEGEYTCSLDPPPQKKRGGKLPWLCG